MLPTFELISEPFRSPLGVFEVKAGEKTVYMSVSPTNYYNDRRAVVIVDTDKFLQLWKNNPNEGSLPHGNPSTWPHDRKFKDAVAGFAHGRDNPVPLGEIGCWINKSMLIPSMKLFGLFTVRAQPVEQSIPCVGFDNGITRTLWLLTHGCKAFPIGCRLPSAHLLYALAGAPDTKLQTVEELLKLGVKNEADAPCPM